MVERLRPAKDEWDDPRAELDATLSTTSWRPTFEVDLGPRDDVPPGAPAWWRGDEEASQSFMREMGIDPTKPLPQ